MDLNVHIYTQPNRNQSQTNLDQHAGQSWLMEGPRGKFFLQLEALSSPRKMQAQQQCTVRPVTFCNPCVQNNNALINLNLKEKGGQKGTSFQREVYVKLKVKEKLHFQLPGRHEELLSHQQVAEGLSEEGVCAEGYCSEM